jgi:Arc/MetJ-type ribon-helix-helix transcriptional regulator
MGNGMASTKVTITLEDEQLDAVRKLVGSGAARSVSGFVQHAVAVALNDVAGWGAMLGQALKRTGGPLTRKELAWADTILKSPSTPKRRRTAA